MRRRNFCAALSAGTVSTLAAASPTGATRQEPTVTTEGHFDIDWGGPYRVEGVDPFEYETNGHVPGLEASESTELLLFVPGLEPPATADGSDGEQAVEVRTGLREHGYEGTVVSYEWDLASKLWNWEERRAIARWNGRKLATVTRDLHEVTSDTTIRYLGHSLGTSVVASALQTLGDWGMSQPIASVSLFGAPVPRTTLPRDGEETKLLISQAGEVHNYWSQSDEVLDWASPAEEHRVPLGLAGLDRSGAETYTDHAIEISDHFGYLDAEKGCFDAVVDDW